MINKIPGNFLYKYLNSFGTTEEGISRRTGIPFDRLSMIVHARVKPTQKEKDAIISYFHRIPDLPNLEEHDLFPSEKKWIDFQDKKSDRLDEIRGTPLEEIKRQQKVQAEKRKERKAAKDKLLAEVSIAKLKRIQEEQNNHREPVRIPQKPDEIEFVE